MKFHLRAVAFLTTLAAIHGEICTSEETNTFTAVVDLFASELGVCLFFVGGSGRLVLETSPVTGHSQNRFAYPCNYCSSQATLRSPNALAW